MLIWFFRKLYKNGTSPKVQLKYQYQTHSKILQIKYKVIYHEKYFTKILIVQELWKFVTNNYYGGIKKLWKIIIDKLIERTTVKYENKQPSSKTNSTGFTYNKKLIINVAMKNAHP
jgi:hypothetical protein